MDDKKAKHDDGDRLADEPGEHPVGVGIGAATGATAGATVGVMGGIVGAAAGAVIGGMAGGLAGKIAAEALDPETEDSYWSNEYRRRPYVKDGDPYSTYRAAYKYGWECYNSYGGRAFDEVEPDLRRSWSDCSLPWDTAKHAARDAWERGRRARSEDAEDL